MYLLTDGDVSNVDEIIAEVYQAQRIMRFFTIGIGNGISPALIQGVAMAGKGDYDFVKDEENIEEKTQYLINSAISPVLTDIRVTFEKPSMVSQTIPDIRTQQIGFIKKNERF